MYYIIYILLYCPLAAAAAAAAAVTARGEEIIIMRFRFMRSRLHCAHTARCTPLLLLSTTLTARRDHFNDGVPGPRRQMPIKCVYVLKSFARDTEGMLDIFGLHGGSGLGIVYVVVVDYVRGV